MKKEKGKVEAIENALSKLNKDRLKMAEQGLSDTQIAELKREKTVFEKSPEIAQAMNYIRKHAPLPGPVMEQILSALGLGQSALDRVRQDGWVATKKTLWNDRHCNGFYLTPKGQKELAEYEKQHK
jgi:hypothetical protein